MLGWFSLVQYFEYNINYYTMALTLKKGTPRVLNLIIEVLPIFIGFIFFGMANFSYSNRFTGFGSTYITLFTAMFGDDMVGTFKIITLGYPIIGTLYMTAFPLLFVFVVFNVFIFIIAESFDFAKRLERKKREHEKKTKLKDTSTFTILRKGVSSELVHRFSNNNSDDIGYTKIDDSMPIINSHQSDKDEYDFIDSDVSDEEIDSRALEMLKKITTTITELQSQISALEKKLE